jgi:hypothetical protein
MRIIVCLQAVVPQPAAQGRAALARGYCIGQPVVAPMPGPIAGGFLRYAGGFFDNIYGELLFNC